MGGKSEGSQQLFDPLAKHTWRARRASCRWWWPGPGSWLIALARRSHTPARRRSWRSWRRRCGANVTGRPCRPCPLYDARAVGETVPSCADALVPVILARSPAVAATSDSLLVWMRCRVIRRRRYGRAATRACVQRTTIAIRWNRFQLAFHLPSPYQRPQRITRSKALPRRVAVCERAGDGIHPLDALLPVCHVRCARPLTSLRTALVQSRDMWRERRTLRGRYRRSSRWHSYTAANSGLDSAIFPGSGSAVNLAQAVPRG